MRRIKWSLFVALIILGIETGGQKNFLFLEQAYSENPDSYVPLSSAQEHGGEGEPLILSFESVTEIGLQNSLDIQIARYDAYIDGTALPLARSIFDTFLEFEATYSSDKKMSASSFAGEQEKQKTFSFGASKKIPSGTTVSLELSDNKNRTDSLFNTINPYHESLAEFSVKQELGKNFFGLKDRSRVKITKLDIENSCFTSLDNIEESLAQIQKSYWNIVLKAEEVKIARDMLSEASRLYQIYKDKYSLGLSEESELLAMEALVLARENELASAQLSLKSACNDLLFLLNKGDFNREIVPGETLLIDKEEVELAGCLREAIKNRRDYKRINNEIKKNKLDLVIKKNSLWPSIDLKASFIRNNIRPRRTEAWQNIRGQANDEIAVTFSVSFPWENREAESELEKSELTKAKLLIELKKTERLILREINDQVNKINVILNQLELLEKTVELHAKKLQDEVERINYGRSSSDVLIQYEEDLLKARLALANKRYEYLVSAIDLELAENTLLDKYWKEPL